MTNRITAHHVTDSAKFDLYCSRHSIRPRTAIDELITMALALPVDILDYLREQTVDTAA
jgi:hypothetical protein